MITNEPKEPGDKPRVLFARPLLNFLLTKTDGRYARLNAFCDLLDRSLAHPVPSPSAPDLPGSTAGQFDTTITELAKSWQWQRATVRTFLGGLVALGYLRIEHRGKRVFFTMDV